MKEESLERREMEGTPREMAVGQRIGSQNGTLADEAWANFLRSTEPPSKLEGSKGHSSPVGFKGNLSLLDVFSHIYFSRAEANGSFRESFKDWQFGDLNRWFL